MKTLIPSVVAVSMMLGLAVRSEAAKVASKASAARVRSQAGDKKCVRANAEKSESLRAQIAGVEGNIELIDLKIGALEEKLRDAVSEKAAAREADASSKEQEAFQAEMAASASAEELAQLDEKSARADRDSTRNLAGLKDSETETKLKYLNDGKADLQERRAALQMELDGLPACK